VNPSGGSLSANPVPATGLVRIAEAYLQLTNKADKRQIKDAKTSLIYSTSGLCFQGSVVFILRKE
jgi:acetyl-CoA C-acetyltransferase